MIDDGYLPAFTHEQNTAALFWYLVTMMTLCGLLVTVAPILPLVDGYDFTTEVPFPGAKYGVARLPLWIAAPLWWALAAVLFVRTGRGLWQRLTR
ncbi:hypothetical protein ACFRFH_00920 [Leifsonia sp. NPDC056824]|uniref:hypothetical protein n=1 Tax=Leifsonia sp. NPDC056824 TaxID=3345953 RepID=UPI00369FD907